MAQVKIDRKEADKVLYQKYPDLLKQHWRERANKAIGITQLDRSLRQEWCAIENRLSDTKPPIR